jgi:hypothetical protein
MRKSMTPRIHAALAVAGLVLTPMPALAQSTAPPPRPSGRISFYMTADNRRPDGTAASTSFDFATSFTFRTPEIDAAGLEAGIDMRHTAYSVEGRPQRVSIYDGYAGARFGSTGQLRVRAGHMWLSDLGTAGALAGGVLEYRSKPAGAQRRVTAGVFGGAEPLGYEMGYATGVTKYGGYVSLENGYLERHVIGVATIRNGGLTERTMLSLTNYIPVGQSFFAYQALEYDLQGPANGAATGGLSYFLINARATASPRVELQGTYNRGRSINARQLTDDVLNGRPLTAQALDGLRYETAGGRVSVKVAKQIELYAGYYRDRNNREDVATGRLTLGGYSSNLFGSGFDVSGSDAMIDRPSGPYHSRYISLGHTVGRRVYVSGDFSTSLAIVRFVRSDGVAIETRPWTRRFSANMSATLNRQFSLIGVVDYVVDDGLKDLRVMTGLTYRIR